MENLRKIDNTEHTPIKGDNVTLNGRYGVLLDNEFNQILWSDNEEIENCVGGWSAFLEAGGYILVI
jgi:hypothetical protein